MAKVFTPEEREEVKARIVEFVRLSGRETFRQLADKTGVSKTAIRRLSGALAASGDVWLSGCGVFPSEQAYRVWRKTPEKAADPTLIRKLPDGEIRRYNWICPYISRHLLSLNPLLACCRRYSRGER
ncbi:DUF977 family protein [Escherichia coli]|uniref:DUF977 family protein n=1 Tax=Escherichia coli TaxID=562 RepID=UPI003FA1C040